MNHDIPLEVKENTTLLPFLIDNLRKMSRDNVKSLLRNKQVNVNGQPVTQFNHELRLSDKIVITGERLADGILLRNMKIVYEDEHIIVIDTNA